MAGGAREAYIRERIAVRGEAGAQASEEQIEQTERKEQTK